MNTPLILSADPVAWAALLTLIAMEIVLGIDNLIFRSLAGGMTVVRSFSQPRLFLGWCNGDPKFFEVESPSVVKPVVA